MTSIKTPVLLFAILIIAATSACKRDTGNVLNISQVYPANGSSNIPTTQTFTCTPVAGAVSYAFYFNDANGSFGDTSSVDSVTIHNLKPCDTYIWIAIATKADGSTVATNNWNFTVSSGNAASCLLLPANNSSNVCLPPTFTWTPIAGASSYNLMVATDYTFYNIIYSNAVSGTSYTISSSLVSANTNYYWQVAAAGSNLYSAVGSFTTIAPPGLISPSNGSTGVSRSPTFTWASGPCGTTYNLDICPLSTFSGSVTTEQVSDTTYTLSSGTPLAAYSTFYWRVRINGSSASGVSSFTTGL